MRTRDDRRLVLAAIALASVVAAPLEVCRAQQTTLASLDASGNQGDSESTHPALSPDGRFVVFQSLAANLVAGDGNQLCDVFVRDRESGAVERVSVDSFGGEGDAFSNVMATQAASADGRWIVFSSFADNLVANDVNAAMDVFVRDCLLGTTEIASVDSLGGPAIAACADGVISADGSVVAFDSAAWNLVPQDFNGRRDVFVHDRNTGITERVSVDSIGFEVDGDSWRPALSADGRYVAFMSDAINLAQNDYNFTVDVFVHDRLTGTTDCVSVEPLGNSGDDRSEMPSISGDGRFVAFHSGASDLVGNDTNGWYDVFVRDRLKVTTTRVSVDSAGQEADSYSLRPCISSDGRIVAFESTASNLVTGDQNGAVDVFLHALAIGYTERLSVDASGGEANRPSENVALSADGRVAAFDSAATNLVAADANSVVDVFLRETAAVPASWTNYDAGFPGTHGVPSFTSRDLPLLGATITLDVDNSYGQPTTGLLLLGAQRAKIATNRGGELLVVTLVAFPISFSFGFDSFDGGMPGDFALFGATIDLQVLEIDPGAAKGVSFTAGLELVLGW